MRLIASLIMAIILIAPACAQERQPEPVPTGKPLTLADCIDLALRNQPSVRQASAQVDARAGSVKQARSGLLPGVYVSSSSEVAGSSSSSGVQVSGGVEQLIYDMGRSRAGLDQARYLLEAGVSELAGSRADLINSVKQAYYGFLRSSKLLSVYQENLKAQEGHVAMAQAKMEAGVAPKADLLKAESAAASARVDLVVAGNDAALARVELNSTMGVNVQNPTEITDSAEPDAPVPTVEDALQQALRNRPEVRGVRNQVAAAQSAVDVAAAGDRPSFSTSISDSYRSESGFDDHDSWTWMVNAQWQPFDSGLTRGKVEQARAQLVSAQESFYETRQTISSQVVSARLYVVAAQESLAAARLEVASAQQELDAATGRYQTGVGIFLEVTDAQAALLKAQVDETSARYGLSMARSALERAVGATSVQGASN